MHSFLQTSEYAEEVHVSGLLQASQSKLLNVRKGKAGVRPWDYEGETGHGLEDQVIENTARRAQDRR